LKEKVEDIKLVIGSCNSNKADNTRVKIKRTKEQATIYKNMTQQKNKDRTPRINYKPGVNSGAPEGLAVPGSTSGTCRE
jgi:hypothetical protein